MSMNWVHESTPTWDDAKEKIIGKAPDGISGWTTTAAAT